MTEPNEVHTNSLHEITPEEDLDIRAGEQMFGRGTWTYIQDDLLHISPTPPRDAWQGKKERALAAARVHEIMEEALRPVTSALQDAAAAIEEAEGADDYGLYPAASDLHQAAYRLRGILRTGADHDDMDTHAPSLFRAVFEELEREF